MSKFDLESDVSFHVVGEEVFGHEAHLSFHEKCELETHVSFREED
jgi:hypothetical protein